MKKEGIQRVFTVGLIFLIFFGYQVYKDRQEKPKIVSVINKTDGSIWKSQSNDEVKIKNSDQNYNEPRAKSEGETGIHNNTDGIIDDPIDKTNESQVDSTVNEPNEPLEKSKSQQSEQLVLDFNDINIIQYKKSSDGIHTPYKLSMKIHSNSDSILTVAYNNFLLRKNGDSTDPTTLSEVTGETRILPDEIIEYDLLFSLKSETIDGYTLYFVAGKKMVPITVISERN